MKKWSSVFLLLLLFTSCTKETEKIVFVPVPQTPSWATYDKINYFSKGCTNSIATKNFLFVYNNQQGISKVDKNGNTDNYIYCGAYPLGQKPLLTPYAGAYLADNKFLEIKPLDFFCSSPSNSLYLPFAALDSSFSYIPYSSGYNRYFMGINGDQVLFLPYASANDPHLKFLLVHLDIDTVNTINGIDSFSCQKLKIHEVLDPTNQISPNVTSVYSGEHSFLVSVTTFNGEDCTFKINSDGVYTKVLNFPIGQVFKYGNLLYGINYDQVYVSADEGSSWTPRYIFQEPIGRFTFVPLGQELYCYSWDKLGVVKIDAQTFNISAILSGGLNGHYITSLTEFDDKVFVSTLSGVFYKPKAAFNILKTP